MGSIRLLFAFLASFISGAKLPIPQTQPEYAGGQSRSGVFQELTLTPANVATNAFHKQFTLTLDGQQIYAQPLFVQGVTIGAGTYDLVIVATLNDSVFAFDANAVSQLWQVSLGSPYVNYPGRGGADDALYAQNVGCASTPVVDRANGVLFVVCASAPSGTWTLYELSIATGGTIASKTITGQFPGTGMSGDTVVSGKVQFQAGQHLQRTGLTIVNGVIYFAFASYGDSSPWHGWVFGYNESDLSQAAVFCTTPNGKYGGIWMTGNALPVDSSGNLYATTGNGDYDGSSNFANSVIKLSSSLQVVDWFTPSNWSSLESNDFDVTSGRVILLGDGNIISGGKDYREFLLNTNCMGHLQGSNNSCTNQIWTVPGSGHEGIFGGVFFNSTIFLPVNSGPIYRYPYSGAGGGTVTVSIPVTTSATFGHPGARMAVSANGTANAILWATTCVNPSNATPQAGILRAFNPATLAEIYNSTTSGADTLGTLAKLGSPLIVSGRVWVPTGDGTVVVYGLN